MSVLWYGILTSFNLTGAKYNVIWRCSSTGASFFFSSSSGLHSVSRGGHLLFCSLLPFLCAHGNWVPCRTTVLYTVQSLHFSGIITTVPTKNIKKDILRLLVPTLLVTMTCYRTHCECRIWELCRIGVSSLLRISLNRTAAYVVELPIRKPYQLFPIVLLVSKWFSVFA